MLCHLANWTGER